MVSSDIRSFVGGPIYVEFSLDRQFRVAGAQFFLVLVSIVLRGINIQNNTKRAVVVPNNSDLYDTSFDLL